MVLIRALLRALLGPAITLAGLFAVVPVAMNGRLQRFNFFDCGQPTTVLTNATEPSFFKPVISPWEIDPDYVLVEDTSQSEEEWSQYFGYVQRVALDISPAEVHEISDIVVLSPAISCSYNTELPIHAIDKIVSEILAYARTNNVSNVGNVPPASPVSETVNASPTPSFSPDEHLEAELEPSHTGVEDSSTQDRVDPTTLPSSIPLDYDVTSVSLVVYPRAKQPRTKSMYSTFELLSGSDARTTSTCVLGLVFVLAATWYFARNGARILNSSLRFTGRAEARLSTLQSSDSEQRPQTVAPLSPDADGDLFSSEPGSGGNSSYVRPSADSVLSAERPLAYLTGSPNVASGRRLVPRRAAPIAASAEPPQLFRQPFHVPGLPGALFEEPMVMRQDNRGPSHETSVPVVYNPLAFLMPSPPKPYFPLPEHSIAGCEEPEAKDD